MQDLHPVWILYKKLIKAEETEQKRLVSKSEHDWLEKLRRTQISF